MKIASQIFVKFRLIFRRSYFWNTVNQRLWKSCPASSNKNSQTKIASHIFRLIGRITADASFWTPFKKEVVSLPFNSESQGAISKNCFSCLMILWLVTEELAGEHRLRKRGCKISVLTWVLEKQTSK